MSDEQFRQLMVAIKEMDVGMQELKNEVQEIKSDVKEIKSDLKDVKGRVIKLEEGMEYMTTKLMEHDQEIFQLKKQGKKERYM